METEKIPRIREQSLCPCKSRLSYSECCLPFHTGKAHPTTAEQLMRARYSAYFFRLIDFLVDTTHPDQKTPLLREQILSTAEYANWKFLTIHGTSKGQAEDKTGKVEFTAQFYHNDKLEEHYECSRFRRHKGLWKYVDDKG